MSTGRRSRAVDDITDLPREFADVVVGGQAGSEGKGSVAGYLARRDRYEAAVRPGSSNAGHTVYDDDGAPHVQQVLPSPGVVDPEVDLLMAAESSFGVEEFLDEVERLDPGESAPERIYVDPKAAIIDETHRELERERNIGEDIGSTVHGCGAVRTEKIWRSAGDVRLADECPELEPFVDGRVSERMLEYGWRGGTVLVEGTQGTQLSINQSDHYPFTTSRDCTASAFLSAVGLAPSAVRDVWVVFRTYPIRAGENSGPMDTEEIDFATIAERAGHDEPPTELTSVTERNRRVFEWSWRQFEDALRLNDPDRVAITFLDYLDVENYGVDAYADLAPETRDWLDDVRSALAGTDTELGLLKTGPKPDHVIDLDE